MALSIPNFRHTNNYTVTGSTPQLHASSNARRSLFEFKFDTQNGLPTRANNSASWLWSDSSVPSSSIICTKDKFGNSVALNFERPGDWLISENNVWDSITACKGESYPVELSCSDIPRSPAFSGFKVYYTYEDGVHSDSFKLTYFTISGANLTSVPSFAQCLDRQQSTNRYLGRDQSGNQIIVSTRRRFDDFRNSGDFNNYLQREVYFMNCGGTINVSQPYLIDLPEVDYYPRVFSLDSKITNYEGDFSRYSSKAFFILGENMSTSILADCIQRNIDNYNERRAKFEMIVGLTLIGITLTGVVMCYCCSRINKKITSNQQQNTNTQLRDPLLSEQNV